MPKIKIKNQEIANEFLIDDRFHKNLLYCISFDQFYLYNEGHYEELSTNKFAGVVWNFIRESHSELNITAALVKDVVEQIKWGAPRKVEDMNTPYIAFLDKLYNMDTFKAEEFDRAKIAIHYLKFRYEDIDQAIPKWHYFLKTTMVKPDGKTDDELINLVQEMFGFYLLNNLKAHKVFFLVGQGANGKSVMLNVLESLIGESSLSAMSIQTLTTNQFATSNLIGRKVNICNEEESKYLRSDKFKALISGDLIDAERKHEQRFAFRPTTKYLFASNMFPTFDGINYGIKRRLTIIPFNRIFKNKEQDKELADKLRQELPGIISWAIAGAQQLVKNSYEFTETEATNQTGMELESSISSAIMFFREHYEVDPKKENFVSHDEIYGKYTGWCTKNGKKQMSLHVFLKDIRNNLNVESGIERTRDMTVQRGIYIKDFILETLIDEDKAVDEAKQALEDSNAQQTLMVTI